MDHPRLSSFPQDLKSRDIWCNWRYEMRDGKQTKVPYQPNGWPASTTNRDTWASLQACLAVVSNFDGIGVFADGSHTFIDLDKCIGPDGIEPWARAILARTNSYTELSPSNTGLHIFVKGAVSKASKINGCECYSTARFFTVTGQHLESTPLTVNEMTPTDLEELRDDIAQDQLRPYKANKPAAAEPRTGGLVVRESMTAKERETKLERALAGDIGAYDNDRSSAVHGALQLLARKHGGDREAIQEEFEGSVLCADWGEKWNRLADKEIDKAVERWEENGKPAWKDAPKTGFRSPAVEGSDDDYVLGPLSEQAGDPVQEGQFPLGEVSLIGGTSGAGKSTALYGVAETQLQGVPGFSRPTYRRPYMIVLRDRGDRDVRLTFRRLDLDPSKVDYYSLKGEDRSKPVGEVIGRILDERPADRRPQLVILEGLDLGVDGTAVKMEDVVPVMDALQTTARHFHVAIVGTVGSPKLKVGEDFANERERLFGSGAWGRMAATVWILTAAGKDGTRVNLSMLGRHSKRQTAVLEWRRGKLVEVAEEQLQREGDTTMVEWILEQQQFTRAQLRKQFGLSGSTVNRKLEGWELAKIIKRHTRDAKEFYKVRQSELGGLAEGQL